MAKIKLRHHFVPQFWIKGFADAHNQIHVWKHKRIRIVGADKIMQENWLYTVFNDRWIASDALENALSALETFSAPTFKAVGTPGHPISDDEYTHLCFFLGLQACRHPDIIKRFGKRKKELAASLANALLTSKTEFITKMRSFHMSQADAEFAYDVFSKKSPDEIQNELDELNSMSPQDPRLPDVDAIRAYEPIAREISKLNLTIVDVAAGQSFVLGDTPLAQSDLSTGFDVPLSKMVALIFERSSKPQTSIPRRVASESEVARINKTQSDNAARIVIGADPNLLRRL